MALIELNLRPTRSQLNWFGVIMLVFFGLVGGLLYFWFDLPGWGYAAWAIAVALPVMYYGVPPLRGTMYRGWMYAILPLAWAISHALLALIYYAMITPLGWVMRLSGRDALCRHWERDAETYWVERRDTGKLSRYFRQY